MKKKRLLLGVLSMAFVASTSFAVVACQFPNTNQEPTEMEQVYAQYVVYAQAEGVEPLSYEDWLATIKGEKGDKGDDGKSAYEIWLEQGNEGTEEDFLAWLKGEQHVHTFGKWKECSNLDADNKILFRACTDCNAVEFMLGDHKAHDWEIVTTEPTCTEQGYDTKTCTVCGFEEIDNYTDSTGHAWSENYSFDSTFHWTACEDCTEIKDKAEHTPEDSGECSVCGELVGETLGVLYDISADGTYAEVIDYTGTATKVRIADTYNGLPVKSIYQEVFKNKNIVSVIIPDSVTSIGDSAFEGCSLTSVEIGDGVTTIGDRAFYECSSLTSVEIGDGVTTIGNEAFMYCYSLTSVVIGDSVTSIGYHAFYECSRLTSVQIGDSVTSIDYEAFMYCYSLTSVVIGDSVTSIGCHAFYECTSLTSIEISGGVTTIGENAFAYCDSLTFNEYGNCKYLGNKNNAYFALIETTSKNYSSYTIHENTKVIANNAFYNCSRLTSITIPDSVTSIGDGAFSNCSSLTRIEIPDSVTSIGDWAFNDCSSLTSVVIGDSVTTIRFTAFDNCSSLTSVYYKGTAEEWAKNSVLSDDDYLTNATRYYYSESNVAGCWHYNENGEIVLW